MLVHESRGLAQKDAKTYIPPGWFITKILKRDSGWQVEADGLTRYKHFEPTIVADDTLALALVLVQAWTIYTGRTGILGHTTFPTF